MGKECAELIHRRGKSNNQYPYTKVSTEKGRLNYIKTEKWRT